MINPTWRDYPVEKENFSYPLSGTTADMQLANTKEILLEKEEEKLAIVKRIEFNLERIESNMQKIGVMLQNLAGMIVQKAMLSALTQPQMHPLEGPFAQPSYTRILHSGPFYPPNSSEY